MNNRPECLPCCLRRVLHAADKSTSDEWIHRKILGEAMQNLSRVDDKASPAEVIHGAIRQIGKTLGVSDPYAEEKGRWISDTLSNSDWIESVVKESEDPFREAAHLAAAANILDCELRQDIVTKKFNLKSLVEGYASIPFVDESLEDLRKSVDRGGKILYVHDTAGELLFDKLFLEQFRKPPENVFCVFRESPILAYATREDGLAVGLDKVGQLISVGTDCLGIPLHFCSSTFREHYRTADLVVAKGQASYETLEGREARLEGDDRERDLFFLLRVKCPLMARQLGAAVGDCVLEQG